ncbi:uncharacterized protein DUF4190 [Kribbella sp. VKM Ac-2527]|uniref:Uncharacterized protein DUF4190 n=1 Tax=Kribbella caucasensis TaxID=2512215 RepID=A0A4R6KMT9_9ACTN|nr:DUF4190 domain-containing protein [Kribbella sp. VKM Ac-2527]TDO52246.1 uncharacterized protein DUF4190 [Kribbella sp. VKM Ac-2527]
MSSGERPQDHQGFPSYTDRPQDETQPLQDHTQPLQDHTQSLYPAQPQYPSQPQHPAQQQYSSPQYPTQPQYPGHPQYQTGGYPLQPGYPDMPAYGALRDNSNATLALVLGLIGLVTGIVLLSPVAWWKGQQALNEIDDAPGVYNNRGMALGGKICGIIGTVLLGLVVLFVAAMVILFVSV